MLAFTTDGARNSPDATRASNSRSVSRSCTRLAWTSIARASAMPSIVQFLIVNAIGRETGEQNSDQRDKADNEAQPNHSLTRK